MSRVDRERGRVAEQAHDTAPGDAAEPLVSPAPQGHGRPSALGYAVVGLVGLAVLGLLALMGYGLLRRQGGSLAGFAVNTVGRAAEIQVRPASDLSLRLFDGGTFHLSEQRGRVVVINFWASWCPPCREEARLLEAAWRAYRDRGVTLVGVDVWDTERDALAFLREFGVTYPNGLDPNGQILIEYGVTGIPETYFVGRDGRLARRWIGPITDRQLAGLIEELLE